MKSQSLIFPAFLHNRITLPPLKDSEVSLLLDPLKSQSIKEIENQYVSAANDFALEASFSYFGKCNDFEKLLDAWEITEKKYSDLGFKTIGLDSLINFVRIGEPIEHLLGQLRLQNEEPVFHADIYRKKYLSSVQTQIDSNELAKGNLQEGIFELPSTETASNNNSYRTPLQVKFTVISQAKAMKDFAECSKTILDNK